MAKKTEIEAKNDGELVENCEQPIIRIETLIQIVRDIPVMLDRDLAKLYGVDVAQLNRQVKRNIERFPSDFMFQLTKEEYANLKCQFGISSWGGNRFLPYAFTEQGVAMLSGVLRSPIAITTNIQIMRAFVAMRHITASNTQMLQRLANIEYHQIETDKRIDEVFRLLDQGAKAKQGIFYDGQIFDAYAFVSDLIKSATTRVVLIDNYIDETVFTLLDKRQPSVSAKIYTKHITAQLQLDLERHNAQYAPVAIEQYENSHDRFLLIDDKVYHLGASLKDLGKRWFAFSLMEELTSEELINRITIQST